MSDADVKLEPCGHCGDANPKEERETAEPLDWFYVQCANPDCGARTCDWALRSSARKAWNRRSGTEALVRALRVAEAALRCAVFESDTPTYQDAVKIVTAALKEQEAQP